MRKETDLEAVKRVAKTFVYLDIQINEQVGFLVNHPFIGEIAVVVKENGKLVLKDVRKEEDLAIVRQNTVNTIDAVTNFQQFIHIVRAPYLPAFFKFTHHFLSLNDYSSFLGSMWTIVEFPNVDDNIPPQEFIRIFRMADKSLLMNDEERRLYLALPDEMTVYRGIRGRGSLKALSWTTDIEQAEWFAKRWDKKGKVYFAKIRKEDVLAVFNSRGESELVIEFAKIKDVILIMEY